MTASRHAEEVCEVQISEADLDSRQDDTGVSAVGV